MFPCAMFLAGEHSCMSSPFSIAILNGTCSLRSTIIKIFWTWSALRQNSKKKKTKITLRFQNVIPAIAERRKKIPFSMDIENEELMHECSPEHFRMGTARFFFCLQYY